MTAEIAVVDTAGQLEIRTAHYSARIDRRLLLAEITGADGGSWGRLRLLASVDTLEAPDETIRVESVDVEHERADGFVRATVTCISTRWSVRTQVVEFHPDQITMRATVHGHGRITTVRLLGGARLPQGVLPSGAAHRTVFSPNPDHPWRIARPAVEPAVVSVNGEGGEPGVGRWLFTPAPTCFGLSRTRTEDDRRLPDGPWLMLGLAADRRTFVEFGYDPTPGGFSVRCEYQGHTPADGVFTTPTVLLVFGARDPYEGLRRYRAELVARGLASAASARPPVAAHWRQPIFCGWGAQCALATASGASAPELSGQELYERLLGTLAGNGLVPGTVVVDDKWQEWYATCRPDPGKWPDLAGFIAARHAAGQRVLLSWKAWDPEGAPDDACVRDAEGVPVAIDPESRSGRTVIEDAVTYVLGRDGLNADGLKIDFTGRTPSGTALRHAGPSWGFDLLHDLLGIAYRTAKQVRPDSLIVTHTPDPGFVEVTDMIRLNDVLHLDHPDGLTMPPTAGSAVVDQMSYRARVVHAACPELPVDTDGWCLPGRHDLRTYAAAAPALGVPALYYADGMDLEPEPIDRETWSAVAAAWAAYRAEHGLETPRHRPPSDPEDRSDPTRR
jgi:hypothetical protein